MSLFTSLKNKMNTNNVTMIDITKLHFDTDFKAVFNQEKDKVNEIARDMSINGFDKTRPIIVTEGYLIVDGHSRYMAAKKAGIKKVPIMYKQFDSRKETIEYEYKMQLNSRRLTDGEYFTAFIKLDEMRKDGTTKSKADEMIGKQLNKSARQICKMREIAKKATPELLDQIKNNKITLNKAYELIKTKEATKDVVEVKEDTNKNIGKGINSESFKLGVLFVLSELESGKRRNQITKDKRIAKLDLSSVQLSESDLERISQRFGIV